MPTITDLRCRACTVMGGMTVRTAADVEALSAIPYVRIAVAEKRMTPVALGDRMQLRPCVTNETDLARYQKEHEAGERDWPCPRVECDIDNAESLELFSLALSEDASRLAPFMVEALLGGFDRSERLRIVRRTLRALGDERIVEARQDLHDKALEQHRARRK